MRRFDFAAADELLVRFLNRLKGAMRDEREGSLRFIGRGVSPRSYSIVLVALRKSKNTGII